MLVDNALNVSQKCTSGIQGCIGKGGCQQGKGSGDPLVLGTGEAVLSHCKTQGGTWESKPVGR